MSLSAKKIDEIKSLNIPLNIKLLALRATSDEEVSAILCGNSDKNKPQVSSTNNSSIFVNKQDNTTDQNIGWSISSLRNKDNGNEEISYAITSALNDGNIEQKEAINKDGTYKEGFEILDLNGDKKVDDKEWDFFTSGGKFHKKSKTSIINRDEFKKAAETLDEFGSLDFNTNGEVSNKDKLRAYKIVEAGHYLEENLDEISPEIKEEYTKELDKIKIGGEVSGKQYTAVAYGKEGINFNIIYDEKEANSSVLLHELTHNIQAEKDSQKKMKQINKEAQAFYIQALFESKVNDGGFKTKPASREIILSDYYWGNKEIKNRWLSQIQNDETIRNKLNMPNGTEISETDRTEYLERIYKERNQDLNVQGSTNSLSKSKNEDEQTLAKHLNEYLNKKTKGEYIEVQHCNQIRVNIEKIKANPNYKNDFELQKTITAVENLPDVIELNSIIDASWGKPLQTLTFTDKKDNYSGKYYSDFLVNSSKSNNVEKISAETLIQNTKLIDYYMKYYHLTKEEAENQIRNGKYITIGNEFKEEQNK